MVWPITPAIDPYANELNGFGRFSPVNSTLEMNLERKKNIFFKDDQTIFFSVNYHNVCVSMFQR